MNLFLITLVILFGITLVFGWGFILWLIAELLSKVFNVIGFFWSIATNLFTLKWNTGRKKLNEYFYDLALSKDQHASVMLRDFFNKIMLKKFSIKFGDPDTTLSFYFAVNHLLSTSNLLNSGLSSFGWFWAKFLNIFERSKGGHLNVAIYMEMMKEDKVLRKYGLVTNPNLEDYKKIIIERFENGEYE
jgi:hypothetical protein